MHKDDELPMNGPVDDGSDDLLIRRAARELRTPVAFRDDFDARVMAAVRATTMDEGEAPAPAPRREGPARRAWGWVVRPRTLRVSPLVGLAVAAGLAAVMVTASQRPSKVEYVRVPAAPRTPVAPVVNTGASQVQFVLVAPDAKSVSLVGDFNDWNAAAAPLTPTRTGGVWTISVPLQPGRYTYNFVVDGTRVLADPAAPPAPADDFGTPASVVTVAGAQT